ncbi:MAG: hypothetical protein HQK66_02955 [Desulfamplus sp.]|nr:hypothetical protein [Desulfamplus sp.]
MIPEKSCVMLFVKAWLPLRRSGFIENTVIKLKVTDPDVIKTGEMDLIDSIREDLDWDVVRNLIAGKMKKTTFSAAGGAIVVHGGEVAFRVDLEVKTSISMLFDRQGNYIDEAGDEGSSDEESFAGKASFFVDEASSLEDEDSPLVDKDSSLEDEDSPLVDKDSFLEDDDFSLVDDGSSLVNNSEEISSVDYYENSDDNIMPADGDIEDPIMKDDDGYIGNDLIKDYEDNIIQDYDDSHDDIISDFNEILSFSGEEDELNGDDEIGSLVKESREFWENKTR